MPCSAVVELISNFVVMCYALRDLLDTDITGVVHGEVTFLNEILLD